MSKNKSIKLRKYTWWWLLFLLPLLLLIPFKKNVYIQTVESESGAVISGADVYFHYRKQSVRTSGSPVMKYTRTTDKNGTVEFYALRYRLYSWIFKHKSETLIYASSNCYLSDTLQPNFHSIRSNDTIILKIATQFMSLNFKVVDDGDNEPLPDATVRIIVERDGKVYVDSAISGADGIVNFEKIPVCGIVKSVIGIADGYFPDSIINKNVGELIGNIDSLRQLRLKPIKKQIVFYVIDCVTKQPIPNATVTIDFEYKNKHTSKTKRTNVNGVGKGTYDDAHIIAEISLRAEKKYYKQGQLPGKYKVRDFLKLPKEKRTICLEPLENCIEFKNTDKDTGKPLAGVKNTIIIDNGGGRHVEETIVSNANGIFKVCEVIVGDKITIIASKPPYYEDNTTTIVKADGITLKDSPISKRTIPLEPKKVELTFRTVDADDRSKIIAKVKLTVIIDGSRVSTPNNSGTGVFKVKAKINSVISIIADGRAVNYTLNDTTIRNAAVRKLVSAPQKDRDIPLRKPEYTVDVVFLIDLSGSMGDEMNEIRDNIHNLYTLLSSKMISNKKYPDVIRLKMNSFGDNNINTSRFYYVPDQLNDFKTSIASLSSSSEAGLDALSISLFSKWQTVGVKKRRIIFLFTDEDSENWKSNTANTFIGNYVDLKTKWDSLQPDTYLIMFLDNSNSEKYNDLKLWKNVSHFNIKSYNFDRVVDEIVRRL